MAFDFETRAAPGESLSADDVLKGVPDAFYALDRAWRFTHLNVQAERLLGRTQEELLGRSVWDEFPEAIGSAFEHAYRRAVQEQIPVAVTEFFPPLDAWFEVRVFPFKGGLSVFFKNIDESRRHEQALRESREQLREAQTRLEAALSAGGIATWTWDVANDHVRADANLTRLFSVSPEDAAGGKIGVYLQAIHPEDRARVAEIIQDALARREVYAAEYRVVLPDGSHRWLLTRGRVERDADGNAVSLPGVAEDVTERVERERREQFLAELTERARRLTDPEEVIADALRSTGEFLGVARCVFVDIDVKADVCICHPDYCADDSVASMAGVFPISAFGPIVAAAYSVGQAVAVNDVHVDPAQVPPENIAAYDAMSIRAHASVPVVHSERLVSCIGAHSATPRQWKLEEVELLRTVVERTWLTVEVTRQDRALLREAEERREAHEQTIRILESITDGFYVIGRDWRFSYVNAQAERMLRRKREELLGQGIWEAFPEAVDGTFHRVCRHAMEDGIPVSVEDYYAPLDSWMDVRVYPSSSGLSVFFQNVNERKKAEAERERLLVELRIRAEREAILNRIGQAIRSASDPEAVQTAAVTMLGEALRADRCYLALYDLARGVVTVDRDWHRAGLPSIQGEYAFPNTAAMFRELHHAAAASIVEDARTAPVSAQTRANMESLGLRSRVSAALVDGDGLMATLTAAMTDAPRAWTGEEVALIEAVATQLRTAVEAARVIYREHTIAQQLQAALQPVVPDQVPGMEMADYYRSALEEAGVGGDFSDVFPADKGVTFLVVGDLSGKGLAAASQVATVRNMLRFALYNGRTVAGPVTALNDTLAANELLTGFATLFVGRYEADTRTLTYVNCGQDAGLILRSATGQVEMLPPTGSVLGAFEGGVYREEAVTLEAGDVLALFTDGLTEAGPTRKALLTGNGVADLLKDMAGERNARRVVTRLMASVDAYAKEGVRDDQCLLVGIVSGAWQSQKSPSA